VLTGTVTVKGTPVKEFVLELSDAAGMLLRSTGKHGLYRLLDVPSGSVILTIAFPPSTRTHEISVTGDLQKPFARIDFDIPVSIDDFAFYDVSGVTNVKVVLGFTEDELITTRGTAARLRSAKVKYHAVLSARSASAHPPITPTHDFDLSPTTKEANWQVGSLNGPYRIEVTLDGITGVRARKDASA
jgi:hypothetical protein